MIIDGAPATGAKSLAKLMQHTHVWNRPLVW